MNWSDAAREELAVYLDKVRACYHGDEVDPDEVAADLQAHFESAARDEGLVVITDHDLRRFIARFGPTLPSPSEAGTDVDGDTRRRGAEPPPVRKIGWLGAGGIWAFVFAVFLPGASYLVEAVFRGCSDLFFDPMPSVWHHLAVLLVIVVNAASWRQIRADRPPSRWLIWGNQAVLILAVYFAVVFIPILPIATIGLVGIIYFGIGLLALLPMAPYFALIGAAGWRRRWNRRFGEVTTGAGAWGYGVALLLLTVMLGPYLAFNVGMQLALSEDAGRQARGIGLLRTFGSREILLRTCYGNMGSFRNRSLMTDFLVEISPDDARRTYYRVTGEPFNRDLPRRRALGRRPVADLWDNDLGGARVGGQRPDVSLIRSRLDGSVDADAAVGYLEWTMEFRNDGPTQEEARGVIQLPAGGVVSRLTLWINGEEREAAFGGRGAVREAYQKVVQRRRDPVLVTTAGPDQVLFQCFPIQPDGGTMQFRVGISFPLACPNRETAHWEMPRIVERNYTVRDDQRHAIWLESVNPMREANGLLTEAGTADSPGTLRGEVAEAGWKSQPPSLTVQRNPNVHAAVARDYVDPAALVRADLREVPADPPDRLALVVDGSKAMARYRDELQAFVQSWSGPGELRIYIAHDQLLADPAPRDWPSFAGGCDNGPALVAAWDWAGQSADGIVLWIHGPQPVGLGSTDALRQRIEWRPDGPTIHHLAVESGPNRIVEAFTPASPVKRIASGAGSPVENVESHVQGLTQSTLAWTFARAQGEALPQASGNPTTAASDHLVRLWKVDDILNRLRRNPRATEALAREAVAYMLVTPVSGAVVLETQQQYEDAGLKPIDAEQAPVHVIPEPGTLWLLLIGAALLGAARRRHTRGPAG